MKKLFGSVSRGWRAQQNAFAKHEAGFKVDKVGNGSYELDANLRPAKAPPVKVPVPKARP
jgi:hypothetical protein